MIEDVYGRPMTPAHAIKGDRRYLYYVSQPRAGQIEACWRLPAGDLDGLVSSGVLALLRNPLRLSAELGDAAGSLKFAPTCAALADRLGQPAALRAALQELAASVVIGKDRVEVTFGARALATLIGADGARTLPEQQIELQMETTLKRRGHELRLVYAAPDANPAMRDDRMIQLIASGHAAYDRLLAGQGKVSATERSHLVRLARLRFLAPDIVTAIVYGRQPVELTTRTLLRVAELPLAWSDQRKMLGFG